RGISQNLSWSFGDSILNMFLTAGVPPCSNTDLACQTAYEIPSIRSFASVLDGTVTQLTCDEQDVTQLNNTICNEIIGSRSQFPDALYYICESLSTLSHAELTLVWRNTCHMIELIVSPLLEPCPPLPSEATQRVARSTLSLSQLFCNYANWTSVDTIDPGLVTMCSDNDPEAFLQGVCNNVPVMQALIGNPSNSWVWEYCTNVSDRYMVLQLCTYEQWDLQTLDPSIVALCWTNDQAKMGELLCQSMDFYIMIFSNSENTWIIPNCTEVATSLPTDVNTLVAEMCRYSEWSNLKTISTDQISLCIQYDESQFVSQVCTNTSFLNALVLKMGSDWVQTYCTLYIKITTSPPTVYPTIPSMSDLCKYSIWTVLPVHPSVIGLCWKFDMVAFHLNVCCNMTLLARLTLDPQNQWLKSVCSDNDTSDLLPKVCLYSDWTKPGIVDMTDLALCADLDTANFVHKVCANTTVLQNLLANLDNTWLLEQCSNLTGSGKENLMGFKPSEQCLYANWTVNVPNTALVALCWDYDQANFISSICGKPAVLSHVVQDPANHWVIALCATCSNYSRVAQSNNTSSSSSSNTNGTEIQPCLVKEIISRLNWSCSVDLNTVCQPDIPQLQVFQVFLRCSVESLLPRVEKMMTEEVTSMVKQATSLGVILMLVMEENGLTTLQVTDNIGQSVLDSVSAFLEQETSFSKKQVVLQCFAKVLTSLMQTGRDVSSDASFFIKQYFQIPLTRLRAVLSSVDINTMRLILHYYNRNQEILQLTQDYLRTMLSVLIQTHLKQDPALFYDLVPLLSLAQPEEIISLPPLQTNLIAINLINSIIPGLSPDQRQAFGSWFSQSLSAANVTAGGPSFIQDFGNLIAYLPFHSFQRLSPAQVLNGLDVLLKNNLGAMKQQFVAQSVFGLYKNLTAEQLSRLANLTCQANVGDLLAYVGSSTFPVIQENIRTCITRGTSLPSYMISSVLFVNGSELQSPATLSPQKVSQLVPLLPLLGVEFLQQLSPAQLVPVLSALTSIPFTPTQ
ncbi:stereocilin-like, partial [Silurus asotus]